jgi:hypothetical protein
MSGVKVAVDWDTISLENWEWGLNDLKDSKGGDAIAGILTALALHVAEVVMKEITGKLNSQPSLIVGMDGEVHFDVLEGGIVFRRDLIEMIEEAAEEWAEDEQIENIRKIGERCLQLAEAHKSRKS